VTLRAGSKFSAAVAFWNDDCSGRRDWMCIQSKQLSDLACLCLAGSAGDWLRGLRCVWLLRWQSQAAEIALGCFLRRRYDLRRAQCHGLP